MSPSKTVKTERDDGGALEIPAQRLLALDRLEQCLEVPLPEAARTLPLDDLEEHRRAVLHRLGEDLQQVAVGIAIDEDTELPERSEVLVDRADAIEQILVVRRGDAQKLNAPIAQRRHRLHDVVGRNGHVLNAGPAVELEVL